jgi:general secretion pathway protein F/type IV pilus assembly protein PilC
MIQAGEEGGALGEVLDQLFRMISRTEKMKKQLTSAMAYPLFLLSFCMIVISCLLLFLIPSMGDLFTGRDLKWITRTVLGLSSWLDHHKGSISVLILFCIGLVVFTLRSRKAKKYFQKISLQVPVVKTIVTQASLVRFCRSLSLLLVSGIPLLQALGLSKKMMRNFLFEEVIAKIEERIAEGRRLSEELRGSSLIPPLVVRMLSLAEETGQNALMLANIAEIYDEELEKTLNRITILIQPIMLLILGFIVAIVDLSVLLPLTDVSSFTQ